MIKIDKNIPMPDYWRGPTPKYPFRKMEVGDSFYAPKEDGKKAARSAFLYAKRYGLSFITRKEGDGTRIWRSK